MKQRFLYGFTLIETMIALLVASVIIVPLSRLVTSVVTRVTKDSELLYADLQLSAFISDARIKADEKKEFEFSQEKHNMLFRYQRVNLSEKSPFFLQNLVQEIISVFSKELDGNQKLRTELITFAFIPPLEKQNGETKDGAQKTQAPAQKTENSSERNAK